MAWNSIEGGRADEPPGASVAGVLDGVGLRVLAGVASLPVGPPSRRGPMRTWG